MALSIAPPVAAESNGPDGGGARGGPDPNPGAIEPEVVVEHTYEVGERPRAEGAVEASVADETVARWNVGGCSSPTCPSNHPGFHPAPRVKVDTVVRSGHLPAQPSHAPKSELSEAGLLAQTRSRGYWPFRLCFEAGLRRSVKLAGKTHVRISIEHDGHVTSSRLVAADLRDPEVSTCLVARARKLRFGPPPRRRTEVDVTIDLTPGDAPLPDVVPGGSGSSPEPGSAALDVRSLEATLSPTAPAIAACYAEGRARDRALWGRVALRFEADRQSGPLRITEHDSHFPDPAVVACITRAVRGVALPRLAGRPLRFVWGVRLGGGPLQESRTNPHEGSALKSSVADSPPPRVRLDP